MDYVRIGLVAKPQGIRGEVKINSLTEQLERFLDLKEVFLEDKGKYEHYNVKGTRLAGVCAFLFLEKIYSRDDAEKLRGKYVCVERANAIELPEGRYFIFDIIGCDCVTTLGKSLGRIVDVLQPGANDVYVVQGPKGEILIPAVKSFVLDINIETKKITVDEKMLEEVAVYED